MSEAITTAELDSARADAETIFLTSTCTLQSPSKSKDATGSTKVAYSNAATNVVCGLFMESRGVYNEEADRVVMVTQWVLYLKHDRTIEEDWRVVHGGDTYIVRNVDTGEEWDILTKVHLDKIE